MSESQPNESRDLGSQPIGALMQARQLDPRHVVAASAEQITHKMVHRAMVGRRLTPHVMAKVLRAYNAASGEQRELAELFNYVRPTRREREREK